MIVKRRQPGKQPIRSPTTSKGSNDPFPEKDDLITDEVRALKDKFELVEKELRRLEYERDLLSMHSSSQALRILQLQTRVAELENPEISKTKPYRRRDDPNGAPFDKWRRDPASSNHRPTHIHTSIDFECDTEIVRSPETIGLATKISPGNRSPCSPVAGPSTKRRRSESPSPPTSPLRKRARDKEVIGDTDWEKPRDLKAPPVILRRKVEVKELLVSNRDPMSYRRRPYLKRKSKDEHTGL